MTDRPTRGGLSRRGLLRLLVVAVAFGVAMGCPARSFAQPLKDNHYALDVFQGPVLAPSDIVGIAGAYAGIAEGIEGMVANAAAPAIRTPLSTSHFDWDASASISFPVKLFATNDDFDNSGTPGHDFSNFIYVTLGGILQYGAYGIGVSAEIQRYSLTNNFMNTASGVVLGKYHVLGAVRFFGDQLTVGVGARLCSLSLSPGGGETTLTMIGAAPEIGVLLRPDYRQFRLGATFRAPVHGGELIGGPAIVDANGVKTVGGFILPGDVVMPWELELGAVMQVGPRPLNLPWLDPGIEQGALRESIERKRLPRARAHEAELLGIHDASARASREAAIRAEEAATTKQEREEEKRLGKRLDAALRERYYRLPREHILLSVELLLTGDVQQGVSIQRFLGQNQLSPDGSMVGMSGAFVTASPRIGLEMEPIPGLVHTRTGSYYEPARLGNRLGRQHFTFGADMRLFATSLFGLVPLTTFKLQAYADFSPRYQAVSLGLGVWR